MSLPNFGSMWREPLLRFLLVGAVFLGVDHLLGAARTTNDRDRIVVTAAQQAALARAFRAERGRDPAAQELQAQLDRWIDEQILYREALALGLDRKDVIVQRQLTQKMRFLLEDAEPLDEPSEAELLAFLERHPERYGAAPTLSLQQVFLSRGRHGERLAAEARRVQEQLTRAPEQFVGLGDPFLVGAVVESTDAARLRRDFGPAFAAAVAQLPAGEWSAPVPSAFGLHLVRVTGRTASRPAVLAEVADRVRVDLRLERREQRNRQALDRLRRQYAIEVESAG